MATPRADQKLARPLFIDRHVIAISKPSGVVSQMHGGLNKCARDHHEAEPLKPILDDLVTKFGLDLKPIPVHRLGKVTWWNSLARGTPPRTQILKGDTLHSISKPSAKITGVVDIPDDRLFLHASQISFTRYRKTTPKKYSVEVFAPLPKDFLAVCHELRLKLDLRAVHGGALVNGENAPWNLIDFESW